MPADSAAAVAEPCATRPQPDKPHPFTAPRGGVWIDCVSRIDRIKDAEKRGDVAWLQSVLLLPEDDLQKTVRQRAQAALNRLDNCFSYRGYILRAGRAGTQGEYQGFASLSDDNIFREAGSPLPGHLKTGRIGGANAKARAIRELQRLVDREVARHEEWRKKEAPDA